MVLIKRACCTPWRDHGRVLGLILSVAFGMVSAGALAAEQQADVARYLSARDGATATSKVVCDTPELSLPRDIKQVKEGVVMIKDGSRLLGTGFFISNDGLILTAAHVLNGEAAVTVTTHSGTLLSAQIVKVVSHKDTALLRVAGSGYACLNLDPVLPGEGSDIYVVGNPVTEQYAFSISKGIVSSVRMIGEQKFIQTDATVNPGSSGGPLVSTSGRAVGLLSWRRVEADGLAFGVTVRDAADALVLEGRDTASNNPQAASVKEPVVSWPELDNPYVDDLTVEDVSFHGWFRRRIALGITFVTLGGTMLAASAGLIFFDEVGFALTCAMLGPAVISIVGGTLLIAKTRQAARVKRRTARLDWSFSPTVSKHAGGLSLSLSY